ncbi:hypothetical protein [Nostoc sp. CCY 9925]|uniref:hypothetical protein n=1 Tax=Nostoc sp. CCY 9925 TaxID=3103865 RepID=UPI0039C5DCA1
MSRRSKTRYRFANADCLKPILRRVYVPEGETPIAKAGSAKVDKKDLYVLNRLHELRLQGTI